MTEPKTYGPEHKAAMAAGRARSKAVRAYLDEIGSERRGGSRRSWQDLNERLTLVKIELASNNNGSDSIKRLRLLQEQLDLVDAMAAMEEAVSFEDLEAGFIANAAEFGKTNGITYAGWRAFGVKAKVLKAAGITRAS